jgi:hypothetical protein
MPGEIVTLQLGGYANYVGAHFWNLQVRAHYCLSWRPSPRPPAALAASRALPRRPRLAGLALRDVRGAMTRSRARRMSSWGARSRRSGSPSPRWSTTTRSTPTARTATWVALQTIRRRPCRPRCVPSCELTLRVPRAGQHHLPPAPRGRGPERQPGRCGAAAPQRSRAPAARSGACAAAAAVPPPVGACRGAPPQTAAAAAAAAAAAGVSFSPEATHEVSPASVHTWHGPCQVHRARQLPKSGFMQQLEEQASAAHEGGRRGWPLGCGRMRPQQA